MVVEVGRLNSPELVMLSGVESLPEMLVMVVLSEAVWLKKQGLHSGMSSELMLMWERPRVQWIVEEGRRGSRRMRRRQGRRNKVESSIVLLSNFLKFLSKGFRTAIQGELRRQLSVVNLRASMACMLDRLHQCGEGGRLRNRRQEWRVREEERMREEREMQWATRMIGRSLLHPGRIMAN